MAGRDDLPRDLGSLVVPAAGSLAGTGDPWEPYRLTGPDGARVEAVAEFLRDLQAAGRPATTQRSYGLALMRWFRFTWAVEVPWDQATRTEARDFCRWVQLAGKPGGARAAAVAVPGRRPASARYASSTVAHCETVCRGFYSYHVEAGTGPLVNPFPLARPGRANAHHNPMDPFGGQRAGLFRPRVPRRLPRQIPDEVFNELFARLGSHRDRALVAFWVSTGARASELLGVLCSGADPGQQLITVIRKGSRAMQQLPASPDAFVWLRLYQQQVHGLVPAGPDDPLWWTLRRPFRPLGYHAARAMFVRANDAAGTGWTLHDLRHTAAYRLARDPAVPITDVQWVLGHQWLSTTQLYVTPAAEDVIDSALAHHRRQAEPKPEHLRSRGCVTGRRAWTCCSDGSGRDRPGRCPGGSRTWQLSSEALAIMGKFPPRPVPPAWAATSQDRTAVVRRMLAPPFLVRDAKARHVRKLTLLKVLDWLGLHPGKTWQERWDATGAGVDGRLDWRARLMADLRASGSLGPQGERIGSVLGTGLIQLIAGDVLRPGLPWLLATASPVRMAEEMARVRDPEGIAELKALRKTSVVADSTFLPAVERIALIMAAKGGGVRDITPGDCLELLKHCREVFTGGGQANRHSPFFYQLLHTAGVFPASTPPTVRIFSTRFPGQLTPGQLVDRYDLACRPVRDLLADYLRERQPGVDYNTLTGLASALALSFWKDLETHHPGISSLRLAPDIAAAWKQRILTRTVRSPGSPGQVIESATARKSADGILTTVRAFYLDLARWALDEPSRWGPWAVPCPIRADDIQHKKEKTRRKARMDQRTRQRSPPPGGGLLGA